MPPILEIRDLYKKYRLGKATCQDETFRELLVRCFTKPLRSNERAGLIAKEEWFWALSDINFDVQPGEVLGIIGRNGSGKSTLLKIISRITDPTRGIVRVRGRLASLLEVGTGFHPELTGRENVFLNGAILGMRRNEIQSKFDEIVAFSEIEQFIDTPVKRYSSGMYVRLAFAVAAHLHPEILVVDEVLAVGDAAFQRKCVGKMSEVSRGGRTVLFVSHNMPNIENLCQRGIVLAAGKMAFIGTAKDAVAFYLHSVAGDGAHGHLVDLSSALRTDAAYERLLQRLTFQTDEERPLNGILPVGARLKISVHFLLPDPTDSFEVGIGFHDMLNQRVLTIRSNFEPNLPRGERVGLQILVCDIPSLTLLPGEYNLRVWLERGNVDVDMVDDAARISIGDRDYYGSGRTPNSGAFLIDHHWYFEQDNRELAAVSDSLT